MLCSTYLKYLKKCRCDKNCNNAACGWDGLDCEPAPSEEKRASELPGNLYVVLTMSMANFNDEIQKRFERYLSIKMGTNLKIKRNPDGTPMIRPFDPAAVEGDSYDFDSNLFLHGNLGIVVYLRSVLIPLFLARFG